jgi:RNA polymerase sigma-70 factor (ECF subfamily)
MADSQSDAELIAASLDRPLLFGQVFERHWDAVFRFFERRLGSEPSADLASEVFRIAFERRARYEIRDNASCRPWLFGIAANLAMKERRRFARHLAAVDRLTLLERGSQDDHAGTVAASVDSEETWSRLRDALVSIDDTSREMLLLVAWEGLSYSDIADAFDIPIGTVRSQLHRSRGRLRALLNSTGLEAKGGLINESDPRRRR